VAPRTQYLGCGALAPRWPHAGSSADQRVIGGVLYVYLLPKSTIPDARARNPNRFFSVLAAETLLTASGNRSNYSHDFFVDTPLSSRYIAYLRYATIFVLAEQVLLLCGGHQEVINVVGDGTELLLNNRPAESGALRFKIVSLDLCRMRVLTVPHRG
jgi:hypothetical protein